MTNKPIRHGALLDMYKKAIDLQLDSQFVAMLEKEIEALGLRVPYESEYMQYLWSPAVYATASDHPAKRTFLVQRMNRYPMAYSDREIGYEFLLYRDYMLQPAVCYWSKTRFEDNMMIDVFGILIVKHIKSKEGLITEKVDTGPVAPRAYQANYLFQRLWQTQFNDFDEMVRYITNEVRSWSRGDQEPYTNYARRLLKQQLQNELLRYLRDKDSPNHNR